MTQNLFETTNSKTTTIHNLEFDVKQNMTIGSYMTDLNTSLFHSPLPPSLSLCKYIHSYIKKLSNGPGFHAYLYINNVI